MVDSVPADRGRGKRARPKFTAGFACTGVREEASWTPERESRRAGILDPAFASQRLAAWHT
jgi:hypothetical protein